MTFETLLYEARRGAAWITLNRPDALNAISPAMIRELGQALDLAQADPTLRAVVLGARGRAFCAGADLKALKEAGEDNAKFLDDVLTIMNRLERFRLPVIAAVNGMALAGGLELLLCCDLVIAAQSAKIGDAHANYGLLPGGGGSVRLPRKIGPTRAKYLMYTGEFVPAAELVPAGLVNEVVPDAELGAAVERLVAKLAAKSPLGLRRMKALVDDGMDQPSEVALRNEILVGEVHAKSFDMQEGLAAFNAKRKPRFEGR
jgi:enoyl-CoA hydratase/carnithine racemase